MIILLTAHKQQNLVLAVFWSAIGFDCHMISIFIFDQHHVATSAHVRKWRWHAWEYRWQASVEQLSCFVVRWRVAVSVSAARLMFVGNSYVIVGGDPLMVELLVGPVSGYLLKLQCSLSLGCLAAWLGNPFGIPRNSAINPIPDLLNSKIFIQILFF
jgi:hypothetical protein